MEKRASELLQKLQGIELPEDQINNIVKSAIERGEVEDDLAAADLDPDLVKSLMGEMTEVLGRVGKPDDTIAKSVTEAKVDSEKREDGNEYIDVEATLQSVVKSANESAGLLTALVKSNQQGDSDLAKGVLALGQLTQLSLNEVGKLRKSVNALQVDNDDLRERLRMPVRPKRISSTTQVVPHPGEVAKSENGELTKVTDLPTPLSFINKAQTEIQNLSKSSDPQDRSSLEALVKSIGLIQAGVPLTDVMSEFPSVRRVATS